MILTIPSINVSNVALCLHKELETLNEELSLLLVFRTVHKDCLIDVKLV